MRLILFGTLLLIGCTRPSTSRDFDRGDCYMLSRHVGAFAMANGRCPVDTNELVPAIYQSAPRTQDGLRWEIECKDGQATAFNIQADLRCTTEIPNQP